MECARDSNMFWLVLRAKFTIMTKCMHCSAAFRYLHWCLPPLLRPHRRSPLQAFAASGRVDEHTSQPLLLLPCPAPLIWWWKLWGCIHYLAPAVTSLVSCPFSELYERCLCQGNTFYWSASLCKELLPGLVDIFQVTGAIVQQYHKSLQ